MPTGTAISVLGLVVALGGLIIECTAVAGMAFYPIRRKLPFKSPIQMLSVGCNCILAGLALGAVDALLLP